MVRYQQNIAILFSDTPKTNTVQAVYANVIAFWHVTLL